MSIYIETPRTIIREMLPEDEHGLFEMDTDPEVHRYVGQRPLETLEECRTVLNYVRSQYVDNGIGRWSVLEKETGEFLGWTGFKLMCEVANGHIGHYDYGYRFKRAAWGKGYATESGRASLQYGIRQLGLKPVYAMTDINNGASRHILEKLGFRFVEVFQYDGPSNWRTPKDRMATWYELPEEMPSQKNRDVPFQSFQT